MEEFLESAPLYQKICLSDENSLSDVIFSKLPAITAYCGVCSSEHTFNSIQVNEREPIHFSPGSSGRSRIRDNAIYRLEYQCKMCNSFIKEFLVRFIVKDFEETDEEDEYTTVHAQKVGQYPAYEIEPEHSMQSYLDEKNLKLYKHGLISESHSYGVGAFAYYRQVVENKIDDLIAAIEKFIDNEDEPTKKAFKEARQKQDTAKKIELVSDYLPTVLKPDGNNVLRMIYTALSDGLHNKSDEDCLEVAQSLRACLVFLIKKIEEQRSDVDMFKKSVKTLQQKAGSSKAGK